MAQIQGSKKSLLALAGVSIVLSRSGQLRAVVFVLFLSF